MTIRPAQSKADYDAARALIVEYAEWLGEDFCLLGFQDELKALEEMYGPPNGALLLAYHESAPVGCIAYRAYGEGVCEMKRLYVVPAARGHALGRKLACALIGAAKAAGHRRMLLDTLPKLATAIALYRELGFVEIEPYYDNPVPNVTFMALDMR